jgi:ATP-binding cassette, subfamily B, bacterial
MVERVASPWRALAALLRPDARRYAWLTAVVTVGALTPLAAPLVVGDLIDRAADGAATQELTGLAVVVVVLALVGNAIAVTQVAVATSMAWRTTNQLRLRLLDHVLGLDQGFHRRHPPGALIERVDGDVATVAEMLASFVVTAASSALSALGIVVVLLIIDWRVALTFVVMLGALVVFVLAKRNVAVGESANERGTLAALFGGIEERLTAGEDLRGNGALDHAMHRFSQESAAVLRAASARIRSSIRLWRALNVAIAAMTVAMLLMSAWLVRSGQMTNGTALTVLMYATLFRRPVYAIVDRLEILQKAGGAMTRVVQLVGTVTALADHGRSCPPAGALPIELDCVGLAYEDGEPVLRNVNLRVDAGRSIGLVGRTGSGKTSLSRLIGRLVDATDGTVRIGGVAIADIPLAELRRRVAIIPQEVQLIAGSIRDNVTLFDPAPSDDEVADALRRVGLDALAVDVHRVLGPGGIGLSAGEAQLVALARAWLRNPDLVVLDEPTARVDPVTEARIHDATTALLHGRTAVVIAHRLSTVDHLDEIVVLERGRIVEHGATTALLADPTSRFARMVSIARMQSTVPTQRETST